jgi:hypothetical protein
MSELNFQEKVDLIKSYFEPVVGSTIQQLQTVQLFYDGDVDEWGDWNEQPISLKFSEDRIISVSWSKFDEIWMASEKTLSHRNCSMEFRWVTNSNSLLLPIIGQQLSSAWLGQGEMSMGGSRLEIWTRLLLEFDDNWLEIFNAMDENGYDLHESKPLCEMVRCT